MSLAEDELRKIRTAGFILSVSYLRVGEVNKAATILEALFQLNPNDIEINALLAHTCLKKGQAKRALRITTRLIKVKKMNPAHFFLHAKALFMLGRIEEAREASSLYLKNRRAVAEKIEKSVFYSKQRSPTL